MYEKIVAELDDKKVKLVAVSKTKPPEMIHTVYDKGQRIFGENRARELRDKHEVLPDDIEWHMIGHLQKNKVKYIAPFVNLIHSVDNKALLKTINKEAAKNDRVIPVLLQIKIAEEESKYGLSIEDARGILSLPEFSEWKNIEVYGVMGMATFTDDMDQVRREFKTLKEYFDQLKAEFFSEDKSFQEISMGMSGDYLIAIEEGATMVRIGSLIFGARN